MISLGPQVHLEASYQKLTFIRIRAFSFPYLSSLWDVKYQGGELWEPFWDDEGWNTRLTCCILRILPALLGLPQIHHVVYAFTSIIQVFKQSLFKLFWKNWFAFIISMGIAFWFCVVDLMASKE